MSSFCPQYKVPVVCGFRVPLLLEVWSVEDGDNVLLGAAQVPLINVMSGEKTRAVVSQHISLGCKGVVVALW